MVGDALTKLGGSLHLAWDKGQKQMEAHYDSMSEDLKVTNQANILLNMFSLPSLTFITPRRPGLNVKSLDS